MENQKPVTQTDEIDLGQLFAKIGDFFKSIGLGFIGFLALLRRIPIENKFAFFLLIIASVAVGASYSNLLKKNYYESTMILSSSYLNKRLVDNTVDKLTLLASEQNKKGLAKILNIPDTLANNLIGFEAKPFVSEADVIELEVLKEQLKNAQGGKNDNVIEQVVRRIEIENRHAFEITIRTLSPTIINNIQIALVNFFRNNDYIKRRIEITKQTLLARKAKLTTDLQKLDSLKGVIFDNYKNMAAQSRQGSNNVILSDKAVTNPIEIYSEDAKLYAELQNVNKLLYLQPDFEIVDNFTEFSEPSSPSTVNIIFYSILVGIVLGYLLVATVSFNKYLASFS
jgi:hypothetical protein